MEPPHDQTRAAARLGSGQPLTAPMVNTLPLLSPLNVEPVQCNASDNLAVQGDAASNLLVIESGWALRKRESSDGRCQVTGIYLPGDLCDPMWLHAKPNQSVIAAGPLRARSIPAATFQSEIEPHPHLAQSVWNDLSAASSAAAEWALLLGLKSAVERVSHLLCEIYTRLHQRGKATNGQCEFQLSHGEVADLTGLSPTHAERTLRDLQGLRLIGPLKHRLKILDFERLARTAAFDPGYLGSAFDWRKVLPQL